MPQKSERFVSRETHMIYETSDGTERTSSGPGTAVTTGAVTGEMRAERVVNALYWSAEGVIL
jgi:hypothetical protein